MDVAALVLSIVAILVAGISAYYTRQQAAAAEGTRVLEAGRRHQELAPVLEATYVPPEDTRSQVRPGVVLTNRGPLDLDRVEVQAVPPPRTGEAAIEGIYDPATDGRATTHETGPLRRGESWTALEVIPAVQTVEGGVELNRGGTASFRCTCYVAGEDPWTVVIRVNFPATPWVW
jgi:hypothetical protein